MIDKNGHRVLDEHDEDMDGGGCDEVFADGVEGVKEPGCCNPSPTETWKAAMTFHVARVQWRSAPVAKTVQAAKRTSAGLEAHGHRVAHLRVRRAAQERD